eukprot:1000010_1
MAHLENERIANEKNEERQERLAEQKRLKEQQEYERVRKEHFAKLKEVAGVPDFTIEWNATKHELVVLLTEDTIAALKAHPAFLEVKWNDENGDGDIEIYTEKEVSSGVMRIPVTKRNVNHFRNGNALRVTALVDSDGS